MFLNINQINKLSQLIRFKNVIHCILRKSRAYSYYGPRSTIWKIDIPNSLKWMNVFIHKGINQTYTTIFYNIRDFSKKKEEEFVEHFEYTC